MACQAAHFERSPSLPTQSFCARKVGAQPQLPPFSPLLPAPVLILEFLGADSPSTVRVCPCRSRLLQSSKTHGAMSASPGLCCDSLPRARARIVVGHVTTAAAASGASLPKYFQALQLAIEAEHAARAGGDGQGESTTLERQRHRQRAGQDDCYR
jgi:hypothetical protein